MTIVPILARDFRMSLAVRSLLFAIVPLAAACGGSSSSRPATNPVPDVRPLASLAATGAIVTPTYAIRLAPELGSTARIASSRDIMRALDDDIDSTLTARGLKAGWVFATGLAVSYKRNPTYAPDPYALAEEPLRAPSFIAGSRLTEPLASQLRTMIALHENARVVLAPIELRFDRSDIPNATRAALRLAVIDPRFSEARWVGEVKTDTASADPRVLTASLARAIADLIVSR
ncbi:MAG TPA: hypothetical protein VH539_17565 [Gemmatimonadaceae bacterium]|jgi:hypothetical protein